MSADGTEVRAVHLGDGVYVAVPAGPPVPEPPRWHVPRAALLPAAALGALALVRVGASPRGVMAAALLAVLVVLAAIDLRWRLLPNRIVLPATGIALAAQLAFAPGGVPEALAAALGAGVLLLVPGLVQPGAIGMGDVKLAALLGAALGGSVVPALVVGFLAMGAAAAVLLLRHGSAARRATIPLGPFLTLGAAVVVLLA
jgi:leader peptidase (prepilin peptidase)/N-methyltransferase